MATIESRLKELGIILPEAVPPVGNYAPFVITGNLLIISGQLPIGPNGVIAREHQGKLGLDLFNEAGQAAARQCAINVLGQAKAALGNLSRIEQCARLGGFVNVSPKFQAIAAVINGASDLMVAVLGDKKGRHARYAVGVAELPLDAAVEIEAMFEISA